MAKEEVMEFNGVVKELLPNAMFRVLLDNNHEIIAHTAGKMRKFRIRVLAGDQRIRMANIISSTGTIGNAQFRNTLPRIPFKTNKRIKTPKLKRSMSRTASSRSLARSSRRIRNPPNNERRITGSVASSRSGIQSTV